MDHAIEHVVGIYIVLLGIACIVGIAVKRLAHLPYSIALVLMGLVLSVVHVGPDVREAGLGKELVFFVLLPPLLFQGALHMQLDRLRRHWVAVGAFATIGVIVSTMTIGGLLRLSGVIEVTSIAMLFGALICATDPVSVLAIFRQMDVPADLKYLVEGESLFNDGTCVVVFSIILGMIVGGQHFSMAAALIEFVKVALGGALTGIVLGTLTYAVLRNLNDHLLENAICLLVCYASFWLAEHWHVSGVIATVSCGLLLGNYGRQFAMNHRTIETVETFFESIDFLINSLLFILIGLELQVIPAEELRQHLGGAGLAILAVLLARALSTYPLFHATRHWGGGYPSAWAHVLNWGGLRGSIPIALLLGLPAHPALDPWRTQLLVIGFAVVCFSLVVQGLTMKPLMLLLKIKAPAGGSDPARHQPELD